MTRLQNPGGLLYNNISGQYMDLKYKVTPGCYQYTSVVLSQKMCQLSGDRCSSKGTSNVNHINDDDVTNNSNPGVLLMKKRHNWPPAVPYACNYSRVSTCKHRRKQTGWRRRRHKTHRGASSVKWLVLITCLCLRGDYEPINQHACQLDVSKLVRTKWVERKRKTHTPQGNKVGFFFSFVALKQNHHSGYKGKGEY